MIFGLGAPLGGGDSRHLHQTDPGRCEQGTTGPTWEDVSKPSLQTSGVPVVKAAQGAGTSVPREPHVMGPQGRDLADGTCRHILVLAYSESLFFLYC